MVERIEVIVDAAAAMAPVPQVKGGEYHHNAPLMTGTARCRSIPTSRKAAKRVTPGGVTLTAARWLEIR